MSGPPVERARRWISRGGVAAIVACLAIGLAFFETGATARSLTLFRTAFWLLVAMPIVSLIAVLIDEMRRRDWMFVAATLAVIAIVAWSTLGR
jgi:uncharacterized membrane protein